MEVFMVYSKQEAAEKLKVSTITIDRNRRTGKLPYHKIGSRVVFTQEDLDKFLKLCAAHSGVKTNGEDHENISQ
jgi:excisionase family DNA binding protein